MMWRVFREADCRRLMEVRVQTLEQMLECDLGIGPVVLVFIMAPVRHFGFLKFKSFNSHSSHHCTKFCKDQSNSCGILKMAAAAILIFKNWKF